MAKRKYRWLGMVVFLAVGSCGGESGGGENGPAAPLRGAEGAEAAVQGALTLASALSVLLVDAPGLDASAVAANQRRAEPARRTAARAQRVGCPRGGSADSDCREENGRTITVSDLSDCALSDEENGRLYISNGHLTVTVEAPRLCGRPLPPGVAVTTEMRNFRSVVDEEGRILEELAMSRLTQRFAPGEAGCGGRDGVTTLGGRVSARRAGIDVAMETSELVVEVTSRGNPCRQTAVVGGALSVRDLFRDASLEAVLDGFVVTSEPNVATGTLIGVAGTLDSQCFGTAEVATEEMFSLDAACPTFGAIAVGLSDGTRARALFSPRGMALDRDIDGVIDAELESCVVGLQTCGR
jgi:hypothetical protein